MTGLIRAGYVGGHIGEVLHACPECPPMRPAPLCGTCGGKGTVDEKALARWQMRVLQEAGAAGMAP